MFTWPLEMLIVCLVIVMQLHLKMPRELSGVTQYTIQYCSGTQRQRKASFALYAVPISVHWTGRQIAKVCSFSQSSSKISGASINPTQPNPTSRVWLLVALCKCFPLSSPIYTNAMNTNICICIYACIREV